MVIFLHIHPETADLRILLGRSFDEYMQATIDSLVAVFFDKTSLVHALTIRIQVLFVNEI